LPSGIGTITVGWGVNGDIPVVGDFDDDGISDIAVWRPSSGVWFIIKSSGGTQFVGWGVSGDIPAEKRPAIPGYYPPLGSAPSQTSASAPGTGSAAASDAGFAALGLAGPAPAQPAFAGPPDEGPCKGPCRDPDPREQPCHGPCKGARGP